MPSKPRRVNRVALTLAVAVLVGGCATAAPTPTRFSVEIVTPETPTPRATPVPTATRTPIPTASWDADGKSHVCRAIASLMDADKVAAALKADATAQRWAKAYSRAGSLLRDADAALSELAATTWMGLPGADSVDFLVDYATGYQADATDTRFAITVHNYLGASLAGRNPAGLGTLENHVDVLEAEFGPCSQTPLPT